MRLLPALLLPVVLGLVHPVFARQASPSDTTLEAAHRSRLALLPIVFSSPDTRLALGVLPQYIFYTAPGTRPSNLRADIYYTRNKQFNVLLSPSVWLPGDRWQLAGKFRLRKWPTNYVGIAPEAGSAPEEEFTERMFSGAAEVLRQLGPRAWVGASWFVRWGDITDLDPANGALSDGSVPGSGRSRAAGIGVVATLDDREHVVMPRSGAIYRVHAQIHGPALGSEATFTSLTLDLRRYVTIAGPVHAAVQALFTASTGDVPFRVLPGVGEAVRGYPGTQYIGRQRWALQAEIRAIPVWWRLGFAVFAGMGDVADRVGDFRFDDVHFAVGAGIRVLMFPAERITIRQDFAFAPGAGGDYLDLNEAF